MAKIGSHATVWGIAVFILTVLSPLRLVAQESPELSLILEGGWAPRHGEAQSTDTRSGVGLFGDAELRLARSGLPRSAYIALHKGALFLPGNDKVCYVTPAGGCRPKFPNISMFGIDIGQRFGLAGFDAAFAAGVAAATDSDTDSGHVAAFNVAAELEHAVGSHVAMGVRVRAVTISQLGNFDHLRALPVGLHVRIH